MSKNTIEIARRKLSEIMGVYPSNWDDVILMLNAATRIGRLQSEKAALQAKVEQYERTAVPPDIAKIADNLAVMRLTQENAELAAKCARYEAALAFIREKGALSPSSYCQYIAYRTLKGEDWK